MLSLMLGFGIVSRLASGGSATGSAAADSAAGIEPPGLALVLFLPFDGLASLYIVSRCSASSRADRARYASSSRVLPAEEAGSGLPPC